MAASSRASQNNKIDKILRHISVVLKNEIGLERARERGGRAERGAGSAPDLFIISRRGKLMMTASARPLDVWARTEPFGPSVITGDLDVIVSSRCESYQ